MWKTTIPAKDFVLRGRVSLETPVNSNTVVKDTCYWKMHSLIGEAVRVELIQVIKYFMPEVCTYICIKGKCCVKI